MQRHPVDEPRTSVRRLHRQFRPDNAGPRASASRAAAACKQMTRRDVGPPRHLIEPAQHRIDFACIAAESGRARPWKTRRVSAIRLRSIARTASRRHPRQVMKCSRRRCYVQAVGNPAIKIRQRTGADRLFLGNGLFVARSACRRISRGWNWRAAEQPK